MLLRTVCARPLPYTSSHTDSIQAGVQSSDSQSEEVVALSWTVLGPTRGGETREIDLGPVVREPESLEGTSLASIPAAVANNCLVIASNRAGLLR